MTFLSSPLRRIAAASAVACLGLGAGVAGAHAATVESALLQARAAAKAVESKREGLVESIDLANTVAGDAEAHLSEGAVSSAVDQLDSTVSAAEFTAAAHNVVLDPGDSEARPTFLAPAAEGFLLASAPEAQSVADVPSAGLALAVSELDRQVPTLDVASIEAIDASTGVVTATGDSVSQVIEDPDVQAVLDRQERDLTAVRAATEELQRTADALDAAAAEVTRVADEVSGATAVAAHVAALTSLDTQIGTADDDLASTFDALAAVGDHVTDPAVLEHAATARNVLKAALVSSADRGDVDSVRTLTDTIDAASTSLDEAMAAVRASHLAWVDAENTRIDAQNDQTMRDYEAAQAEAQAALTEQYRAAVAAHQNGWTGAPTGVTYANGRVPASQLCSISFAPGQMLQCDAAQALERADAAYMAETGQHLSFTDTYRSYASQVATRAAKPTTAAVPGTSNHGWGMAVDFDPASAAWMTAHGAEFGWVHPAWARSGGSKPESWHLEFVAPGVADAAATAAPELIPHVASALPDAA
ncbi:M15 family metallopeptidase [Demequina capsici]|uniref:M15 family metallopeptidase n=1 Tax=Demequina capsici TaxID=3075620 RepID=A0AA96J7Q1_9MICO|nr:M15 family metallopeptidase [Demequina sp. OYTSA14]WNM24238.1 M15 family metallopeptidase [Demequina sp. OYTSA14]